MVFDSNATAPIPSATNTKNLGKKKRTNRSAKLKQNKIDARREQWLSQGAVKNKGCKDGVDDDGHVQPLPTGKHSKRSLEQLERRRRSRGEEDNGSIHQGSDSESPSNSPTCNDSGTNFTGSSSSSSGSSRSSSSSSAGCWSGNITEEDEEEECLDDWEAMADALAADDKQHQNPCSDLPLPPIVQTVSPCGVTDGSNSGALNSKPESPRMVPWASGNSRAWRADDSYRPQCLPNLSKQLSMPNPGQHCGGGAPWNRSVMPSSCPICCEDLDLTDSSFLPCLCGFRLCLFCHKRILEEDGRCPGCRKPYECEPVETEATVLGGSLTLRLARSCSLIERNQDTCGNCGKYKFEDWSIGFSSFSRNKQILCLITINGGGFGACTSHKDSASSSSSSSCPFCHSHETLLHMLRDCPRATSVWVHLVAPHHRQSFFSCSLWDWMVTYLQQPWSTVNCNNMDKDNDKDGILFAATVWLLWKERKTWVPDGSRFSSERLLHNMGDLADDYGRVLALEYSEPSPEVRYLSWCFYWNQPPSQQQLRLVVDSSHPKL